MEKNTKTICPNCGAIYRNISLKQLGKSTRCQKCKQKFIIRTAKNTRVEWQIGETILDLYTVKGILGVGGMGTVYRVYHKHWQIDLAVKTLLPKLMHKKIARENFEREAETWVNLGLSPHTVCCYYVRILDGIPRVFSECIEGGSLRDWIKKGTLYEGGHQKTLKRILDITIQFAWGLDFAHEKGLIHQDVKPANVMMTPEGIAKVTDFGLAKARGLKNNTDNATIMTTYGGMTPAYCSPEQAALVLKTTEKKLLDRRTDIWSWAVSVLEMFTGEVTWSMGNVAYEAMMMYLENGPQDSRIPRMPQSLADILIECFQKCPADRPHTLKELIEPLTYLYQLETELPYPRQLYKDKQ